MHDAVLSIANKSSCGFDWVVYNDDLLFHAPLYTKGIIAIKPIGESYNPLITEHSFKINDRTLSIQPITPIAKHFPGALIIDESHSSADSALPASAVKASFKEADTRVVDKAVILLNKVTQRNIDFDILVFNTHDNEEIFLPLAQNGRGFYLFPWLSKENSTWQFTGFEQFVTTGYLLGADLVGRDNLGRKFPLFKHNIDFYNGEFIASVIFNPRKSSPHEEVFFFEFEKMCDLINRFANESKPKKLLFHLPYLDYVLFAIALYLHNRITISVFKRLIEGIFVKKQQYAKRVNEVCQKHNIKVTLVSPFENLLNSNGIQDMSAQLLYDVISRFLEGLGVLNNNEISATGDAKSQEKAIDLMQNEFRFVQQCLTILRANTINIQHAKVWNILLKEIDVSTIHNLEELFKVANAAFIAIASNGRPDYKTCSILPLSKKQTQVSYSNYCKKNNLQTQLPAVFNLTFLDSFLTYSPATNGLLLDFDSYEESIVKMIKDTKLMENASQIISTFARYQTAITDNVNTGSSSLLSITSTSVPPVPSLPTNSIPSSLREQTSLNIADHQAKRPRAHSCSDISISTFTASNFLLFKGTQGKVNDNAPVNEPSISPASKPI